MTFATAAPGHLLPRVLLALVAIVAVARLLGWVFARAGQPPVIGELIAGLLLGPTLLGDFSSTVFASDVRDALGVLANLGLIVFMFLVGLHLDLDLLRRRTRSALSISLASVGVPLVLGIGLAAILYPAHGHGVAFAGFALFIATALAVTAFPVLARILADTGLARTGLGALALACAAIEDVIAWVLLTLALAVATTQGVWEVPRTLIGALGFAALLLLVVRPLLRRLAGSSDELLIAVAVCGTAVSACVTELVGVHLVLGAVLFGIAFPREAAQRLERSLQPLVAIVLLPVFFALPGLAIDLSDRLPIVELVLIVAVACIGKFVAATGAARGVGMPWRESVAIGTLMNTRGLMELVVLNVGHSAGIIDDTLYGLFVVMAVVTTVAAGPVMRRLYPSGRQVQVLQRRPALPVLQEEVVSS